MEVVQAVLTSIEILKNIWSCNIGEFLNYKKILDESMQTLTRKMELLRSQEDDINTKLRNPKYLGGTKQKKEVETWLKNVQDKISEVQHIEEKVGKKRYFSPSRFLRLVEKKIQDVVELIEEGRFPEGLVIDVHQDQEEELMTTPLVGQSIKEINLEIWEFLLNDGTTSIGVYGMGGIGKTTIVTHLHNRLLKSTSIFGHVYWVPVSQESNIHKLQDEVAKVLRLDLLDEQDERKRAAKLFKELTERKKFVLILDDMWKVFPLEKVGIPIGVNAGKLVVTTRSLDVCRGMNCQHNIKVVPLSMEEAWDLFMQKLGRETVLAPEVEEIAKSIAKECAGLPLAIITAAVSMRGVDNFHEWRNALNELREPTKGLNIDMESEVFKLLKFSYDRLNDEKLRQCLLYCALFPEDHKIKRVHLIACLIAEGLVDEMKTRQVEFDRGHALLNKLENACLLERTRDHNGEICVKMHNVIRDMALNITSVNPRFMVKAGVELTELPNEREWSENLERVSLMHNEIKGQISSISPKCPRLCTLMLQANEYIREIPNSLFVYMQNLKVLDLSYLGWVEHLPDSIFNLEKLRALLLNNCKNLRYVPSLAKLTELRELDLRWTDIDELPHGMEKLVNLKRLDLMEGFNKELPNVFPSGVLLNLSHLQSLRLLMSMFKITNDLHVKEIISLRQLEFLAVLFIKLQVFINYVNTQHWQRLSHYSLQVVSPRFSSQVSDEVCCRQVHIHGCNLIQGGEDPLFLPTNIQQLGIFYCHDLTSLLDISSSLKNARELERCLIDRCEGIEHLWSWSSPSQEEESVLQSLRTLVLNELPNVSVLFNFKGLRVGGGPPKCGTFSNLKLFIVGRCRNLKYVFTCGLVQHHLQNLEVIHVYECYEMENIIVAEEEEKQEEIAEAKDEEATERNRHYNDNNSVITCPKLQRLVLGFLPKLKSIWRGTTVCHSLEQIEVTACPMLKRLPLSLHLNDDAQTSFQISGEQDWWDLLEWDHPDAKFVFQPLLEKKIEFVSHWRGRAQELWRKDAERYEK